MSWNISFIAKDKHDARKIIDQKIQNEHEGFACWILRHLIDPLPDNGKMVSVNSSGHYGPHEYDVCNGVFDVKQLCITTPEAPETT